MNKLLVICGPTATGKTNVGVQVAKRFLGELISADSRQVYEGMDIGTGKDLPRKVKSQKSKVKSIVNNQEKFLPLYYIGGVPVWMYDVVKPDQEFSVSHFQKIASQVIIDICGRHKAPIVVGGTGLYIQSLLEPIDTIVIPRNYSLREKLSSMTLLELQKYLQEINIHVWDSMNNSDRNNARRLVRKIEISSFPKINKKNTARNAFYDVLQVGLTAPIEILTKHINNRVHKRLEQGIVSEIQTLLDHGYSWDAPSLSALGYQEWRQFEKWHKGEGTLNQDQVIALWTTHEIQYAKKQITWFKRDKHIHWFDVSLDRSTEDIIQLVSTWYNTR